MWKPKTMENILLDVENDSDALYEKRLQSFKSVDDIDAENQKLITERTIKDIPQKRKLKKAAEHGKKFKSTGKADDKLTDYLVSFFHSFFKEHSIYPRNKEVVAFLEAEEKHGFIHYIDDAIEWGTQHGSTTLLTLFNRLTKIRKKLGIKKSR